MNIYFAGAIRGGRDDKELYFELIQHLKNYGIVLSEHIFLDAQLEQEKNSSITSQEIYERDMQWVQQADVVVADVTMPSLGVGYELASAEHLGTPTLCLFRTSAGNRLSAMIGGSTHFTIKEYASVDQAKIAIDAYFKAL